MLDFYYFPSVQTIFFYQTTEIIPMMPRDKYAFDNFFVDKRQAEITWELLGRK